MKNNRIISEGVFYEITKTFKIMRITLFIILASILQSFASTSYSQITKLTLDVSNKKLVEAMDKIEQLSEFYFLYNEKLIDTDRKVSINAKDQNIDIILDNLFASTDIIYTITDRKIILAPSYLSKAQQPQNKVSGTVSDESGLPLPGVTVVIKGTTQGTITDGDGKYTLPDVPSDATLVFSFVGMKNQEVPVGDKKTIDVTLSEETIGLNEVVAVGYGVQKKATITGSTSIVEGEELASSNSASVGAKLQGKLSGVSVVNDNKPGGEATINIRGISTINNSTPLYVIDGIPATDGLTQINSNDIESISVLKDASSAAIYGVRAANGVILITTKRGKVGELKPRVTFSSKIGVQNAKIKDVSAKMCSPQEYADLVWLEFKNEGYSVGDAGWFHPQYGSGAEPVLPDYLIPTGAMEGDPGTDPSLYSYPDPYNGITKANKEGTNWYDEVFDPAVLQEYNLSVSGGTSQSNYAFSTNYLNQEGVIIYTGFDRFSLRLNADTKVNNWLKLGESLSASFSDQINYNSNSEQNAISFARDCGTILPVYDIMGNFAGGKAKEVGSRANPVATQYRSKDNHNRQTRVLGNIYGQITFLKDFTLKSFYGIDYRSAHSIARTLYNPESALAITDEELMETYIGGKQWNWTNTLNYIKSFGAHNINVLLGNENVNFYMANLAAKRDQYFDDTVDYMILDAGQGNQTNSGSFDEWATISYFGRINYDYQSRYLAEVVVRRDGSSRFSKINRWGNFPAFSLGWRISEEPFMASLNWLDNSKIRFGWGKNGNDQIGNYNSYSTYGSDIGQTYYPIDGSPSSAQAGFKQLTLGDVNAKWETSTTKDIGLDANMFKNKLSLTVDVYEKLTSDMLYQKQLPAVLGSVILPNVNIGEMKNSGFDIQMTYRNKIGKDLNIIVGANLSHYKNEVLKLNDNADEIVYLPGVREGALPVITAGQPMGVFYGFIVDGIFNTQEEVDSYVPYNTDDPTADTYSRPGVFKFRNLNGDDKIDNDDRTVIGNPHPDFTYGFNLGLTYKHFDLSAVFNGSYGNDIINYDDVTGQFNVLLGTNKYSSRLTESWTAERYANGDKISQPIALKSDNVMVQPSSFFIQDGSYLRMQSLQVGYSVPQKLLFLAGIKNMRVYFQGTNLLTFTKYTGLDPEVATSVKGGYYTVFGLDNGVYPLSQTFLFGLDINF